MPNSGKRYQQVRKRQMNYSYDRRLTRFVNRYVKGRPTVILLPGGMGSQLCKSEKKFKEDKPFKNSKFPVVWYDTGLLFEADLKKMKMKRTHEGYEDNNRYIVVPDGGVRFLYKPYDDVKSFFESKGYNFVVFGFDWRSSLVECASYFQRFLNQMRDRVKEKHNEDLLPNLTMVAHSQGGLVMQFWLLRHFPPQTKKTELNKWFKTLFMVGTPFYGTSNHMQRYFEGEMAFNFLYGKDDVRQILSSFPGTYILMPLDYEGYLSKKDALGLDDYPVLDPNGNVADPYDHQNFQYYPKWVSKDALKEASQLRKTLNLELCDAVRPRVYNLYATGEDKTYVQLKWNQQESPDDKPVTGKKGRGDGTVPEWSGRLVEVPDENVMNFKNIDNHVGIIEYPDVLDAILNVMEKGVLPAQPAQLAYAPTVERVSKDELNTFLNQIKTKKLKANQRAATDPKFWKALFEEMGKCNV